ncbi:MAG TPA: hypothetical protein VID48_11180, partial [Solirubrobacteraceae bacterium]
MNRRSRNLAVLVGVLIVASTALWVTLAAGDAPKTIECKEKASETTKAVEQALEAGGSYVFQCFQYPVIQAPKPAKNLTGGLAPGFKVAAKKSVSFSSTPGELVTFENGEDRQSRIFTVAAGGSLTLKGVIISATAQGPSGIAAGKAKTNGEKGEKGEEEEEVEEGMEELAKDGSEGKEGKDGEDATSEAGGDGKEGGDGGFVGGKALAAPAVQGGAISNAGTVTLEEDEFQADFVTGGFGGNGGGGGSAGAGGSGGAAGVGSDEQECGPQGGPTVSYWANPPGTGGDGARGGDGGPGTSAGNGGEAQGGAVYNSGTLTVKKTTFRLDDANGGIGGNGGSGGGGGAGGNGGDGDSGGEGGVGGNAGPGAAAGNGASGLGGAIYNSGNANIENSNFAEDRAEGGQSGSGGDAGDAGKGGSGASADPYDVCEHEHTALKTPPAGDGADGGLGAEGGNGANGGNGEGGAIYNAGSLSLAGSNTFEEDTVVAGLGASSSACEKEGPCAGKGSEGGDGGEGGSLGEPAGSPGNQGARDGASGGAGTSGAALANDIFGQSSGAPPEENNSNPGGNQNSNSSSSSTSKSGGSGGKGGGGDDNGDEPSD